VARLSGSTGISEPEAKHLWGQWTRAHRDALLKDKEVELGRVGVIRLSPEDEREVIVKGINYKVSIRIRIVIKGFQGFMLRISREVDKVFTNERQERRPIFIEVSKKGRPVYRSRKVQKYGNYKGQNNQNDNTMRDMLSQGEQIHRCSPLPVDIRVEPRVVAPCACESHETHPSPSQSP
jgi:hypothetical protein